MSKRKIIIVYLFIKRNTKYLMFFYNLFCCLDFLLYLCLAFNEGGFAFGMRVYGKYFFVVQLKMRILRVMTD